MDLGAAHVPCVQALLHNTKCAVNWSERKSIASLLKAPEQMLEPQNPQTTIKTPITRSAPPEPHKHKAPSVK